MSEKRFLNGIDSLKLLNALQWSTLQGRAVGRELIVKYGISPHQLQRIDDKIELDAYMIELLVQQLHHTTLEIRRYGNQVAATTAIRVRWRCGNETGNSMSSYRILFTSRCNEYEIT